MFVTQWKFHTAEPNPSGVWKPRQKQWNQNTLQVIKGKIQEFESAIWENRESIN